VKHKNGGGVPFPKKGLSLFGEIEYNGNSKQIVVQQRVNEREKTPKVWLPRRFFPDTVTPVIVFGSHRKAFLRFYYTSKCLLMQLKSAGWSNW